MSIEQLLQVYNIPYVTEHKHSTSGWVNVHCPFCAGTQNFHLGIKNDGQGCHCWRCGGHSAVTALSRLLNLPSQKVKDLLAEYSGGVLRKTSTEPKVAINPFKFPSNCIELDARGRKYLIDRGFDPDYLQETWGIKQTGPVSILDKISYTNRILIPIKWNGKVVSFQTRDMTNKSDRKYLACPMKREVIHHKHILYGDQEAWKEIKALIVVEGVFDVWRFGKHAAATFGTSFTMEQVLALARSHNRFFIVYDNETHAQGQARKLAIKLRTLKKEVDIKTVEGDPGEMKQEEANYFIKQLMK